MDRTIVRGQGIDRQPDLPIRIGLLGGMLEAVGQVGIPVGILGVIGLGGIRVAGRVAIPGETGRLEILAEIVREGTQEAHRAEGMPGIVLAIRGEQRLAIREGIGRVVEMPEPGLVGLHLETPAGIDLAEIQVGMREGTDLRPITRGLHGILMRDFRREGEEAIGRRGSSGLRNRLNSGLSNSLNNGLSRDHRLPGHGRVGSAGITMPERRGRRAIAVEPVLVAAVETGEVETNETSQSRVAEWINRCGAGGLWHGCFAGSERGSEDVSHVQGGGEGVCNGGAGE
jgi:hypothetical protein